MKILTGKVVSTKMAKTVVVQVERQHVHPLYKKFITRTKRYKAHNDDSGVKMGDIVRIISTRPISKEKHYKILKP